MSGGAVDSWDPAQYRRFQAERRQPFDDLVRLVRPVRAGRVLDVGCGTGHLTGELHAALDARETLGLDSSPAMLAEAVRHERAGLSFRLGDAGEIGVGEDVVPGGGPERGDGAGWDLVFANASLQWVPDHAGLLPRLRQALAPGGQLAFQVPANSDHPSHLVASEVAAEAPFAAALAPCPPDPAASVLPAEEYAEILDRLGVADQHVRLQVYGHHLDSQDAVVEWVSGTLLTRYRSKLDPASYDAYLARYRARLSERLGPSRPYFYAYKRILVWARFP